MISSLKDHKRGIALAVAVILAITLVATLNLTKPYAVYANGTKVTDPYVLKAGEDELLLVKDGETAEAVIQEVLDAYSPDGAQINSIVVDKQLIAEEKELQRGQEPPIVMTKKEAVAYILEMNSTDSPLFSVTINAETGSVEGIKAGTEYEKNDDMYEGQTKTKSKGEDGNQIVTNQITSVNGKALTSTVVDTAVVQESTDKVVYKGTKERPKDTIRTDYGGTVIGSGNGATVANFALQFVGNPYVYGGTSLTNGADCSGFVQSVYKHFGISLPRTVGPQSNCGKGVSYSEAKAGDLICYSGHIGIYIGGGKIVHASTSNRGICVTEARYCGPIVTVRRIVE